MGVDGVESMSQDEYRKAAVDAVKTVSYTHLPDGAYLVGETPSTQDIKTTITADYNRVNNLSMPVSYTHLDVYKRQVHARHLFCPGKPRV